MELAQFSPEQQALLFPWLQTAEWDQPEAVQNEFADVLKSIDDLSEEEAQVLLEREQQESPDNQGSLDYDQ